jgi:hypothetical protein
MKFAASTMIKCATVVLVMGGLCLALPLGANASAVLPGVFNSSSLAANDDLSTGAVPIGFTVNFFGVSSNQLFVNNNGNVTFGSSLGTFTPFGLTTNLGTPIIAPFFGDVDTRVGNIVTYGQGTLNGHAAFGVNWPNVGYFGEHIDKLNNFQLVLVDRPDTGAGNFDIMYNYNQIQWETGDASDGSGGLGGFSARVGYSNGTGSPGTFFELAGSGVNGAFLDSNNATGLIHNDLNSNVLGQYIFFARNGSVIGAVPEPSALSLFAVGLGGLVEVLRRRKLTA